ncbi:hypothetical protein [Brevibacterium aurantiacum]|uniref:Uncharacterized protein n=1 Tax=Brevibacterium aurantiacum TaxID=273384 RepID=A0A556C5I2_BREAU|nr:hypothetical protein [Brevibacterium aurantiacum]TSI12640.1 hypothetical protein FO013_19390 [Brevibacterium aurantiacum]
MPEPAPAQLIRNLCDQVSDAIETIEPTAPISQYGASEGSGGTGQIKYPMTDAMLEARSQLKGVLVSWTLLVAEEKPDTIDCKDEPTSIAAWLYQRAGWLALHPACSDLIMELREGISGLLAVMDRHIDDRRFCGWHNGKPVYARHDQTQVVVDGAVYTPNEGQDRLKVQTASMDLTAKDCAAVLMQVHGMKITPRQILKMLEVDERDRQSGKLGEHEGLSPVGQDGDWNTAPLLFRFEEVLIRVGKSRRVSGLQAS